MEGVPPAVLHPPNNRMGSSGCGDPSINDGAKEEALPVCTPRREICLRRRLGAEPGAESEEEETFPGDPPGRGL